MGITGMDHLAPPMADDQPMYEAIVTTTWLAAHTARLRVGSLVLCDAFRHPAVLARQAVSLDHASHGRFDLGIGWGSVPDELVTFGVSPTEAADRVARLRETLDVLEALWSGETVDHEGPHHHLRGARQEPRPLASIPIVIGGTGPRTLALVRDHADWWNVHVGALHKVEELRAEVGDARVSIQEMVAFVPHGGDREAIIGTAAEVRLRGSGRRERARARRPLRPAGRSRHRACVHVALRLRATRDARCVRRRGHRTTARRARFVAVTEPANGMLAASHNERGGHGVFRNPDHITIAVTDADAAIEFFELVGFRKGHVAMIDGGPPAQYMGMPDMKADHITLELEGSDPRFEIQLLHFDPTAMDPDEPRPTNLRRRGFNHLTLRIDDIRAATDHLEAHGVTMLNDEMDYISRRLRFFEGPEGITLELVEWVDAVAD